MMFYTDVINSYKKQILEHLKNVYGEEMIVDFDKIYYSKLMVENDKIVGCILCSKNKNTAIINNISLNKEYFGKGYSTKLFKWFLHDFSFRKDLHYIFIVPRLINKNTIEFYKEFGFKEYTIINSAGKEVKGLLSIIVLKN